MVSPEKTDRPGDERRMTDRGAPGNNRRFFFGVLLACVFVVAFALGFAIFKYAFDTREEAPEPRFDLSSVFLNGAWHGLPDGKNPSLFVQEHLERLRRKDFSAAYKDQTEGLRDRFSVDEFTSNARRNEPLFRDVEAYSFPGYTVNGNTASVSGFVEYASGDKSKVDVSLVKEGGRWKIATMTLVYQ